MEKRTGKADEQADGRMDGRTDKWSLLWDGKQNQRDGSQVIAWRDKQKGKAHYLCSLHRTAQVRATGANTQWPGAGTAGVPTSVMPARGRRRLAVRLRVRGLPPTWRQRGKTPPPEESAQETPRDKIEVEEEYESASEEAMEEEE